MVLHPFQYANLLEQKINNVPNDILNPALFWKDKNQYWKSAKKLAVLFMDNFKQFGADATNKLIKAGPKL